MFKKETTKKKPRHIRIETTNDNTSCQELAELATDNVMALGRESLHHSVDRSQVPLLTTPNVALTPREKKIRCVCPLRVVVRFRAVVAENLTPKALRTTTSEVFLVLGQKKLGTHVVVVFGVVICHTYATWPRTGTCVCVCGCLAVFVTETMDAGRAPHFRPRSNPFACQE